MTGVQTCAPSDLCACCTVVIAGKVFRCSRCHLVYYCGKDCQASIHLCCPSVYPSGTSLRFSRETPPIRAIPTHSTRPSLFQAAHWHAAHKIACGKPQEGGEGGGAQLQPRPRVVTAADRARWLSTCQAARDLSNTGKYAESRTSMVRLMAEIEGALLDKDAKELVEPLRKMAYAATASGQLDDAYNIMMRAMVLCEKLHGEEGLQTCQMRTTMGESR